MGTGQVLAGSGQSGHRSDVVRLLADLRHQFGADNLAVGIENDDRAGQQSLERAVGHGHAIVGTAADAEAGGSAQSWPPAATMARRIVFFAFSLWRAITRIASSRLRRSKASTIAR